MTSGMEETLGKYEEFFRKIATSPEDPLPVPVDCKFPTKIEMDGVIQHWIIQYLNLWKCPQSLIVPLVKNVISKLYSSSDICDLLNSTTECDTLKLMQCVIYKVRELSLNYVENKTLLYSLPEPRVHLCDPSVFTLKNRRKAMEDRHLIIDNLQLLFQNDNTGPISYYAIFDGHNGADAAIYSTRNLHRYLVECPMYPYNLKLALLEAFKQTDREIVTKFKAQSLRGGSTAVCILLHHDEKKVYVAWVGDSEALLADRNKITCLVNPHVAGREDEKARIDAMGGIVIFWSNSWRVDGQLAVSRSIGDPDHKPHVCAVPDIQEVSLIGDEDFLIMGSDGLWDFLKPCEAAKFVYQFLIDSYEKYEEVGEYLAKHAKKKGSQDNITVIVVFLKEPSLISSQAKSYDMEAATVESAFAPKQNGSAANYENGQNGGPTNGKTFEEDDFGPETDVDGMEDVLKKSTPLTPVKAKEDVVDASDSIFALQDSISKESEGSKVEGVSEDSEDDEWDYIKSEGKSKRKLSLSDCDQEVSDLSNMNKSLNPDAAEFVPVSPMKDVLDNKSSGKGDVFDRLLRDEIISSSPKRGQEKNMESVPVPSLEDFQQEIRHRPSDGFADDTNGADGKDDSFELSFNPVKEEEPLTSELKPDLSCDFSTIAHFGDSQLPDDSFKKQEEGEGADSILLLDSKGDDESALAEEEVPSLIEKNGEQSTNSLGDSDLGMKDEKELLDKSFMGPVEGCLDFQDFQLSGCAFGSLEAAKGEGSGKESLEFASMVDPSSPNVCGMSFLNDGPSHLVDFSGNEPVLRMNEGRANPFDQYSDFNGIFNDFHPKEVEEMISATEKRDVEAPPPTTNPFQDCKEKGEGSVEDLDTQISTLKEEGKSVLEQMDTEHDDSNFGKMKDATRGLDDLIGKKDAEGPFVHECGQNHIPGDHFDDLHVVVNESPNDGSVKLEKVCEKEIMRGDEDEEEEEEKTPQDNSLLSPKKKEYANLMEKLRETGSVEDLVTSIDAEKPFIHDCGQDHAGAKHFHDLTPKEEDAHHGMMEKMESVEGLIEKTVSPEPIPHDCSQNHVPVIAMSELGPSDKELEESKLVEALDKTIVSDGKAEEKEDKKTVSKTAASKPVAGTKVPASAKAVAAAKAAPAVKGAPSAKSMVSAAKAAPATKPLPKAPTGPKPPSKAVPPRPAAPQKTVSKTPTPAAAPKPKPVAAKVAPPSPAKTKAVPKLTATKAAPSAAKPQSVGVKTASNGDANASKPPVKKTTMTSPKPKAPATATTAAKPSGTSVGVASSKAPVNLATRTCLAPPKRPSTAGKADAVGKSPAKRPATAAPKKTTPKATNGMNVGKTEVKTSADGVKSIVRKAAAPMPAPAVAEQNGSTENNAAA